MNIPSFLAARVPVLISAAMLFMAIPVANVWSLEDRAQEIDWETLVPPGWNPGEPFERYSDVEIEQMSAEEINLLEVESQMIFDQAPTVDTLDGRRVRMPGYLLPLEFEDNEVSEFFLVPYLGACIHVPPPPANQIVYGSYEPGYEIEDLYTPVWISGKLKVERASSQLGETGYEETLEVTTGYTMKVEKIEPYLEFQ